MVDDCSTDGSPLIMERYAASDKRIRVIRQTKNQGAAAARNRGLQEAAGRYIAFLDADDLWKPRRLSAELTLM